MSEGAAPHAEVRRPTMPGPAWLAPDEALFFLHIPKTAGTTVRIYLENGFTAEEVRGTYFLDELADLARPERGDHRFLRGHFTYDLGLRMTGRPVRVLTMVRDPVERFISRFGQMKRAADVGHRPMREGTLFPPGIRSLTLDEFVRSDHPFLQSIHDGQTRYLGAKPWNGTGWGGSAGRAGSPSRELRVLLQDPPDLAAAQAALDTCDLVGVVERMRESMDLFALRLGLRPWPGRLRYNRGRHRPSARDVSPDTLERIRGLVGLDQKLYEHANRRLDRDLAAGDAWLRDEGRARRRRVLGTRHAVRPLEQLYQERMERDPAAAPPAVRFGRDPVGFGWQDRETHPVHGHFLWSGPTRASDLDVRLPGGVDLDVEVRTIMAATPLHARTLRMRVGGRRVRLVREELAEGVVRFTGRIAKRRLPRGGGLVRVRFATAPPVRPMDVGGGKDDRPLGVAFHSLAFTPAG